MKSQFRAASLAICVSALFALQLPAQVLTGSISGNITDASGAGLPEGTVSATSPALRGAREATADGSGAFKVLELPPGTYEIRVTKTGFRPVVAQKAACQQTTPLLTPDRRDALPETCHWFSFPEWTTTNG